MALDTTAREAMVSKRIQPYGVIIVFNLEKREMKYVEIIEDSFTPLMGNVTCGQFFKHKGNLCLRIGPNDPAEWEAYDFVTKKKIWIPHTTRVQMVDFKATYSVMKELAD